MTRYGKVTKAIYDELRAVVGPGGVVMDDAEQLDNYAWDQAGRVWGHMPEAVVKPSTTQQVSDIEPRAHTRHAARRGQRPQRRRRAARGRHRPLARAHE